MIVASTLQPLYAGPAAAKSAAEFDSSETQAHQRRTTGAFFMPANYGGCAWDAFGRAGSLCTGLSTHVQLPPIIGGGSYAGATVL